MRGYKKNVYSLKLLTKQNAFHGDALIGEWRNVVDFQFIHFFFFIKIMLRNQKKPNKDNSFNIRYFLYRLEKVQSHSVSVAIRQFFTTKINLKS